MSDPEAVIREALHLGVLAWRKTPSGPKFLDAQDALTRLLAERDALAGEVRQLREALSHTLDVALERWHETSDAGRTAPEWMGLSPDQYAMYAECRWADLAAALAAAAGPEATDE